MGFTAGAGTQAIDAAALGFAVLILVAGLGLASPAQPASDDGVAISFEAFLCPASDAACRKTVQKFRHRFAYTRQML